MGKRMAEVIKITGAGLLAATFFGWGSGQSPRLRYPETRKVDHVDTYHGVQVPDPYRWLEDDNSAETAKWVEEQNKVTFGYLETIPYREKLKARLEALYNLSLIHI